MGGIMLKRGDYMAMSMKEIRAMTGLSIINFSILYHIPPRTIEHWESQSEKSRRKCPDYVLELLERAVREDFNIKDNNESDIYNRGILPIVEPDFSEGDELPF